MDLKPYIKDIADFPQPGIIFKDITPLLKNPDAFASSIDDFQQRLKDTPIDLVAGVESRGFIFAAALAQVMHKGFIPVRKFGKLPDKTLDMEYALEYGTDKISIHADAIYPGQHIALVDDVLATGGTARAAADLIKKAGGIVSVIAFVMELSFLNGREKLPGYPIVSLLTY